MKLRFLGLVLCAALFLVGCAQNSGTAVPAPAAAIQITDAWVRPAAINSDTSMGMDAKVTGALYLTIQNRGVADKLLKAESDVAEAVELHDVSDMNGMMAMRPVAQVEVPANGMVQLKPGGFHFMLIGLKRDLKGGDTVDFVLTFEKSGKQTVHAAVRAQ